MESQPKQSIPTTNFEIKSGMSDTLLFAKLLLQSPATRLGKSDKEIAIELGVSYSVINRWKQGDAFPKEDKLPAIAKAYDIDYQELTRVFLTSKQAREKEKSGQMRVSRDRLNR
jgi:transcriptional regulator with XRE-family HTH domain